MSLSELFGIVLFALFGICDLGARRARQQLRYGGGVDFEQPGRRWLPFCRLLTPPSDFGLLLRRQLWSASVTERAREPVELPDHEHVALAQLIRKLVKFGRAPPPARSFLTINTLASSRLQRRHLSGGVLFISGDLA